MVTDRIELGAKRFIEAGVESFVITMEFSEKSIKMCLRRTGKM